MLDFFDDATLRLAEAVYLGVTAGYFTIWAVGALGRACLVSVAVARGRQQIRSEIRKGGGK